MRTFALSFGVLAGALAFAGSIGSAHAETFAFSSLPAADAKSEPERVRPESIPATEHVEGIQVLARPVQAYEESYGYQYVQVTSTGSNADGHLRLSSEESSGGGSTLSFARSYVPEHPSKEAIATLTRRGLWPRKVSPVHHFFPLHVDRWTQRGDTITLESSSVWVDRETLGSRVVSKSMATYKRLAAGPSGIAVYAAKSKEKGAEILVSSSELPTTGTEEERRSRAVILARHAEALAVQDPSGMHRSSASGFATVTLAVKPGGGQMATIVGRAFLPPAGDAEEPDTSRFESDGMSEERLKSLRDMLRRQTRTQRTRPVAVNVSLSQMESESAPVLSVTFGWAGKDEELRF